ncbi:MAG: hypothetical protein HY901_15355 [Deltaproteobacteria bacterium]|nr:hypothetical protein [Deltaproteobacteria bacterium]
MAHPDERKAANDGGHADPSLKPGPSPGEWIAAVVGFLLSAPGMLLAGHAAPFLQGHYDGNAGDASTRALGEGVVLGMAAVAGAGAFLSLVIFVLMLTSRRSAAAVIGLLLSLFGLTVSIKLAINLL